MSGARRAALSACLVALSLALHAVERTLPPLPLPGAHLGLANGVALLALWQWGLVPAMALSLSRVVLASLAGGRLGGPGFWLSVGGALASLAVMGSARGWAAGHPQRLVPLSILGGVAHNLGQLAAFRLLVHADGAACLMPALVLLGAASGAAVGEGARRVLPAFDRAAGQTERPQTPAQALAARTGGLGASARPVAREVARAPWPHGAAGVVLSAALLASLALAAGGDRLAHAALSDGRRARGALAARIEVAGEAPRLVPLAEDRTERIEAGPVQMVVEVRGGRVRVRESTCPDRFCVRTGWIERPGQSIVCVPGLVVITVVADMAGGTAGAAQVSPWPGTGLDAVDAVTR